MQIHERGKKLNLSSEGIQKLGEQTNIDIYSLRVKIYTYTVTKEWETQWQKRINVGESLNKEVGRGGEGRAPDAFLTNVLFEMLFNRSSLTLLYQLYVAVDLLSSAMFVNVLWSSQI